MFSCRTAAAGQGRELAIVDISKATSVISEDVIDTMTRLGMLKYSDGEHHIIATPVCFILRCCSARQRYTSSLWIVGSRG